MNLRETKRTTIYLPPVVHEHLKKKADAVGVSVNSFVIRAIVNQLEKCGDFEIREIMEEGTL